MDKFVRYCPKCNKKLTYSTGRAKRMADSKNSKCKSCTFKSEVSMSRNCPKCSKEIVYTNRNSARVAAKKNSICHSCSMSHDIPLTRDCPNCGKLLTYISKMTRQWAAKNNSPCKSCGQKLKVVPKIKKCIRCGKSKRLNSFYPNISRPDGHCHLCKICDNQRRLERAIRQYSTDIQYKLSMVLRLRVNHAIHNNQKGGSAVRDLGCSMVELKEHLEKQFYKNKDGTDMSWGN